MPDIDVIALLIAKPGSADQVAKALHDLVAPTRAEPGCISYELFTSATSDTTFFTVEKWRSQADLDAHMQTPHIHAALAAAGDHLAAAPGIHPLIPYNG
ncbi:MAG: putative monooxygenase [Ilumatobacteraceae bacterium]|nr:putative monooxygenase [Ilumatobacteraceae bacterium]